MLTHQEKMALAKKLTGLYKRYHNQQRIFDAIEQLIAGGKKVTNAAIKTLTGHDIKTIRHHRQSERIDLEFGISSIIDEYSIEKADHF